MYNTKKLLVTVAATLVAGTVALTACDKFKSYPQVGVVNFMAVQQKAKVYQDAAEKQKKYDEKLQAKLLEDKEFVKWQEEAKQLEAQQKTLPAAEFERKQSALQMRFLKINEKYRPEAERNMAATQKALKDLEKQIAEAVEATSKRTGTTILLPVNSILYASEKADLTDVFVEELDKRVQTVDYPNPETLK